MIHKTSIDYEGGVKKLAEDLGDLRYDVLSEFLYALAAKLSKDGHKDKAAGRDKISMEIHYAASSVQNAWKIAKPYMDENFDCYGQPAGATFSNEKRDKN